MRNRYGHAADVQLHNLGNIGADPENGTDITLTWPLIVDRSGFFPVIFPREAL